MPKKVVILSLPFTVWIIFSSCHDAPSQVDKSDDHGKRDFAEAQKAKARVSKNGYKPGKNSGDVNVNHLGGGQKESFSNPHKTDQIIVKFKRPRSQKTLTFQSAIQTNTKKMASGAHLKNLATVKTIANMGLVILKNLDANTSLEEQVRRLSANPLVEHAEPDWIISVDAIPSDPLFLEQWGWHQESGIDIMAPDAWDISQGASNVIVGVIDTGVDYTHEDLAPNMWRNPDEIPGNGIDDDNNGYVDDVHGINTIYRNGDPMDDHYHGTHCAGTIGAVGNNNVGVTGACWNVRLMALKFLNANGKGFTSNAIASIDYAIEMGAQILNNSWGSEERSVALVEAIARAEEAGILFVAAAGNETANSDELPQYPAAMANENILSVASISKSGELSHFSNYGPESVDIAAPGGDILSTFPTFSTFSILQEKYPTHYHSLSGTSMAAPHVAGIAALLKAHDPTLTWRAIKDTLLRTATRESYLSGKIKSGGVLSAKFSLMNDAPPSISVANLDNDSIVSGIVDIEIDAEDDEGVATVEVYVDDSFLGEDRSFPFQVPWNTTTFSDRTRHTIEARVVDTVGRRDSSTITVMTSNSSEPAVYIHSISPDVVFRTATPIEVSIQPDAQIKEVELYIDDVLVDTDASRPWSFHWNTPAFLSGKHVVTARAYDSTMKVYEDRVVVDSKQGVPAEEREALLSFYNSTHGDNWRKKAYWKKSDGTFNDWGTEYRWQGILLNASRVVQIDLANNNLQGTLPSEMSKLNNLGVVSLDGNHLTGPFPSFLRKCAELESLNLGSNELSGELPLEIGQIIKLKFLAVDDNDFTGAIPAELANLTQLKTLLLGWNRFTGHVPGELAETASLEKLLVNSNLLKGEVSDYYLSFPGGFFFGYNGLYTDDDALRESLDQKFPNWNSTQTVPPENISATFAGDGISLDWTPNGWRDDMGFSVSPAGPRRYRVYHSTVSGGPYEFVAETPDEKTSRLKIDNLDTAAEHFFVVTMFSPIFHWVQYLMSEIESDYSEEIVYRGLVPTDSTSPHIINVTPANGRKERGDVWLSINATDSDSGIAWVSMEIVHHGSESRVELFESDSVSASHTWDTQAVADGRYRIRFRVYDQSGNLASEETTIEIDNRRDDDRPPEIVWYTPYNGTMVSGLTAVGLNAIDGNYGPSGVFRISSEIVHKISGVTVKQFAAGPHDLNHFMWNTSRVQNGDYAVIFRAFDLAGNVASTEVSISVANSMDKTPPAIVHSAPTDGEVVDGIVQLVIDAVDAQNNLAAVSVGVFAKNTGARVAFFESMAPPASFAWDTEQVENGDYAVVFRATDSWDNGAVAEIDISIENSDEDVIPPSLGTTWPRDGDVLQGEVQLRLSAFDAQSGISGLTIEVINAESDATVAVFESDLSPTQHAWDSRNVPDGKYEIRYCAIDNFANDESRVIAVTVDNIVDRPSLPDPDFRVSKNADFSTDNENFETTDILYLENWDPSVDHTQMKKAQYTLEVATFTDTGQLENRDGVFHGAFDLSLYPIQGAPQEGEIRIELEDRHGQISQFTVLFRLWPAWF